MWLSDHFSIHFLAAARMSKIQTAKSKLHMEENNLDCTGSTSLKFPRQKDPHIIWQNGDLITRKESVVRSSTNFWAILTARALQIDHSGQAVKYLQWHLPKNSCIRLFILQRKGKNNLWFCIQSNKLCCINPKVVILY